jgi:amidohydrolase
VGAAADERARVLAAVERELPAATELARWMAAHPELSLEERETSARYASALEARGFAVARRAAGLETAFVASWGSPAAPLRAALLAEMDALPEIGHACGHNLSGPASLCAAFALAASLAPEDARILVVGSPAEEIGVGKRRLVEAGVFAEADVAMMAHASDMRRAHRLFLGNRKFVFTFHGRAAHAAASPERGINALDSVIALFVSVGLLRQQLPAGVRVHGIVTEGGKAANVIPERAAAEIWVRALDPALLASAAERLAGCAEGAAASTGTRLEVRELESSSPVMKPNLALAGCYREQLAALGLEETPHAPDQSIGSSDVTHVSLAVPTIHPNFPIGGELQHHTRAVAEAAASAAGEAGLGEAARALALCVLALARDPELRARVAREFGRS